MPTILRLWMSKVTLRLSVVKQRSSGGMEGWRALERTGALGGCTGGSSAACQSQLLETIMLKQMRRYLLGKLTVMAAALPTRT